MGSGGTVRQKGDKWIWVGYFKDENGKEHRPSKSFKTRKEAETYKKLQEKNDKHIKNLKAKTDYTVEEFYKIWQKETKWDTEEYYHINTTTNWRYQFTKNILPYIGKEKLQNINYSKLQDFFALGTLSDKTYKNIIADIKSMLSYAKYKDDDLVIVDNLYKVKILAKKKPKVKVYNLMSEAEYEAIKNQLKKTNSHYANLIVLLHETGLRIDEALALKPENINFNTRSICVVSSIKRMNVSDEIKNNKRTNTKLVESYFLKSSSAYREVPMLGYAYRALVEQIKMLEEKQIKSQYLFPTKTGNPADKRNVLRAFHEAIRQCNEKRPETEQIPLRGLHSLRKLFCKLMRDVANWDWEIMAIYLGHSDSAVTRRYYYSLTEEDVFKAAREFDRLDKRLAEERMLEFLQGADAGQAIPDFEYYMSDDSDF